MKKNYSPFLFVILVIFLVFTACQVQPNSATELPTDTTDQSLLLSTPSSKMAKICGRIVTQDGTPAENMPVMFAEVYYGDSNEDGAFVLNTASSPASMTDMEGYFCTTEISASDYVLVIGSPDADYEIYPTEDEKAQIWSTTAGQILDLGEIITNLDL